MDWYTRVRSKSSSIFSESQKSLKLIFWVWPLWPRMQIGVQDILVCHPLVYIHSNSPDSSDAKVKIPTSAINAKSYLWSPAGSVEYENQRQLCRAEDPPENRSLYYTGSAAAIACIAKMPSMQFQLNPTITYECHWLGYK